MFESIQCDQLPECCTTGVVNSFPEDEVVEERITKRAEELQAADEDLTKRAAKREAEVDIDRELRDAIQERIEDTDYSVHVATVSEEQTYALDALKSVGFTEIGHYEGQHGRITFLATGLNLRRQR